MKALLALLFSCFLLVSCKKETPPYHQSEYYQVKGNVLIVVCSQEIDSVYEITRTDSNPIFDSVPIQTVTVSNFQTQFPINHILLQGNDSIYIQKSTSIRIPYRAINPTILKKTNHLTYADSTSFQNHSNHSNSKVQNYWNKIAGLTLVKKYRENNSSKIVYFGVVDYVYDEELGLSIPTEKAIFVFVRN
jgi:hypothetical protein